MRFHRWLSLVALVVLAILTTASGTPALAASESDRDSRPLFQTDTSEHTPLIRLAQGPSRRDDRDYPPDRDFGPDRGRGRDRDYDDRRPPMRQQPRDPMPVARLLDEDSNHHFYTISPEEADNALRSGTWRKEGPAFRAFAYPARGTVPVYRFVNTNSGDHVFTISVEELESLGRARDWRDEGPAFYVFEWPKPGTVPIYRFYSPKSADHFLTASESERRNLLSGRSGYRAEAIAFYAYPP
jgi:hypothetical protein